MRERLDQERGSGLANAIASVKAAAKHLKLLSKSDLDLLETFRSNCAPEYDGQTDKNSARLDQFDDPRLLRRFIHLSDELMREAMARRGTRAGARLAVLAVAFKLALHTAARGANISGIDYTRHLHRAGNGVVLRIPKGEVKNKKAIECDIAPKLIAMLDDYLTYHHPVLAPDGSNWLFPNEADPSKPRPDGSLMNALSTAIRRRLQIDFSGHTFRHLVGKLVIGLDPSLAPLVPRILGHSARSSATDHYVSLFDRNSFKKWDQVIDQVGRKIERPKPRRPHQVDDVHSSDF
jgi:integrase